MKTMSSDFPEAGAVAYTTYKRTDGFEVSITLRDASGSDVLKRLDAAIEKIKSEGGTAIPLRGNGFPKKQAEVVQGKSCPKCGANLIKGTGKVKERCENNKYDFMQKKNVGTCDYIEWNQMTQQDL
jgi:ssDNA-binding Zn-finger/Zn-ribbon topoisomerase 1